MMEKDETTSSPAVDEEEGTSNPSSPQEDDGSKDQIQDISQTSLHDELTENVTESTFTSENVDEKSTGEGTDSVINNSKDGATDSNPEKENDESEEKNIRKEKSSFSHIDYLRFRDNLYEVIEELRIRRSMDSENEERIRQLVTEKHELERKNETEIAKNKQLSDQHDNEIADAKKQSEDKIRQLEDDKHKLTLGTERHEKEIADLKNEIRALMLSKYSLEKKIKEQEHVIKVQSSAKDTHVIQVVDLEQKIKEMSKEVTEVTECMERLEENVQASCKLNKKLAYINQHKQCELDKCRKDLDWNVKQLKLLRIELNRKPDDMTRKLRQSENQVESLQQQLNQKSTQVQQLKTQLEMSRSENKKTLHSLEEAHQLVSRHADSSRNNAELVCDMQSQLSTLRETSQTIKTAYDEKDKELSIHVVLHQRMVDAWQQEEKSLKKRLQVLQDDYEALSKSHADVEALNTDWAKKNTSLSDEIKMVKENLDRKEDEQHEVKLENEKKLLTLQEQLDASMRQVASLQQELHQWKSAEKKLIDGCETDVSMVTEEEFFSPPTSPQEQNVVEPIKTTENEPTSSHTIPSCTKEVCERKTQNDKPSTETGGTGSKVTLAETSTGTAENDANDGVCKSGETSVVDGGRGESDGEPAAKKRREEDDGGEIADTDCENSATGKRKRTERVCSSVCQGGEEDLTNGAVSAKSGRKGRDETGSQEMIAVDGSEQRMSPAGTPHATDGSQNRSPNDEKSKRRVSFSRKPVIFSSESETKSPPGPSVVPTGILKSAEKIKRQETGSRKEASGCEASSDVNQKAATNSAKKTDGLLTSSTYKQVRVNAKKALFANTSTVPVKGQSPKVVSATAEEQSPSRIIPALSNLSVSAASTPMGGSNTVTESVHSLCKSPRSQKSSIASLKNSSVVSDTIPCENTGRSQNTATGRSSSTAISSGSAKTATADTQSVTQTCNTAASARSTVTSKSSHSTAVADHASVTMTKSQSTKPQSTAKRQLSLGATSKPTTEPARFKYHFVKMPSIKSSKHAASWSSDFGSSSQPPSSAQDDDGSTSREHLDDESNSEPLLKPKRRRHSLLDSTTSPSRALFSDDDDEDMSSEISGDISRIQNLLKTERLSKSRLNKQSRKK